MKINFSQKPLDGYGKEFQRSSEERWTLGAICVAALDLHIEGVDSTKIVPTEVYQRGALAVKIINWELEGKDTLSPEDLSKKDLDLIKDRVGKAFAKHAMLVFSTWTMLTEGE